MSDLRLAAFAFLLALAAAPAQQAAPPEIDFPKGDQAWTVTFQAAPGGGKPPPQRGIDIVRKGNIRRDRITWSDGHATEQWWIVAPAFLLFEDGPGHAVSWMKGAWARGQACDETLFQWVDASTFVETAAFQGRRCRVHRTRLASGTGTVTSTAWIDEETRRPAAYAEGGPVALFAFGGVPAEPLAMPERFQAAARKAEDLETAPKRFGQ